MTTDREEIGTCSVCQTPIWIDGGCDPCRDWRTYMSEDLLRRLDADPDMDMAAELNDDEIMEYCVATVKAYRAERSAEERLAELEREAG